MSHKVHVRERAVTVDIVARRPALQVRVGEHMHEIAEAHCAGAGEFEFTLDGRICRGWRYASVDHLYVRLEGRTYVLQLPQSGDAEGAGGISKDEVRAEVPGTLVSVACEEGKAVSAGEIIVTIESMKMQMGLPAPRDGVIAKIHFERNASFDRGAVLVSLAPLDSAPRS
ncbi:MAG: acetyl-CoA carboxylase biotin carboxyl carrier protein subunit [Burkholderiales bacterium]